MKIVCQLQYHGGYTAGWQEQLLDLSIARYVKEAIKAFSGEEVMLACAGRTDKGVHAVGQVISFSTNILRSLVKWKTGLNHFLPKFIRIQAINFAPEAFHPRYHAIARTYRYYCTVGQSLSFPNILTFLSKKPDLLAMNEASLLLLGRKDFSGFRGGSCQAKSPVKVCYRAQWSERNNILCFEIQANAFLHHMVRYLVGCLLEVGYKHKSLQWFENVINLSENQDFCAKAEGLYFCHAHYPDSYKFGFIDQRPWFDQLSQ
jgi:tRNA pseudouridine38-40 synthase